uniref:Uncharacterized protein n=1 Tax=Reclinomonas americana ATCC 50283 TaxID=1295594 RepID=M4QAI4_RECAM|nr:hypothetical protein [Reclinomonas americana ATCC 50283]
MYRIFCFCLCFFYSYFFSCFLLNSSYDLFYSAQYFSSLDFSFLRILNESFESGIVDDLDLQKNKVTIETIADIIINESIDLKKNIVLSIFILYDLSLLKEMTFYSNLLNTCINDLFFLYNFFDTDISKELIKNTNSFVYLIEEYVNSLNDLTIVLKNIDCPYVNSELYIKNFINEIIT